MDLEANMKFIKAGVYLDVMEANLNRITSCRQVQRYRLIDGCVNRNLG